MGVCGRSLGQERDEMESLEGEAGMGVRVDGGRIAQGRKETLAGEGGGLGGWIWGRTGGGRG